MEDRLQALELKLMDMEMSVEQLNQVVIEQQAVIERLDREVQICRQRLAEGDSPVAHASEEVPPPHY